MAFISMVFATVGIFVLICLMIYLGIVIISTITLDSIWLVRKHKKKKTHAVLKVFAVLQSIQFVLFIIIPTVLVIIGCIWYSVERARMPETASEIEGVDWSNAIMVDDVRYIHCHDLFFKVDDISSDPRFTKAALLGGRYVYSLENQTGYDMYAIININESHPYVYVPEDAQDEIIEFYTYEADKAVLATRLSMDDPYMDPESGDYTEVEFDDDIMAELIEYSDSREIDGRTDFSDVDDYIGVYLVSEDGIWDSNIRLAVYGDGEAMVVEGVYDGKISGEIIEDGPLKDYVQAFIGSCDHVL